MTTLNEDQTKEAIAGFLRSAGFDVDLIPEGSEPTPDLVARKDISYLIEVKSKEDDFSVVEERRRRLAGGEIVGAGSSFTPQNTISRAIKKGARQLESFSQSQDQIRLLWLLAKGSDAEAQREQFRSTFYGLAKVVGPDDSSLIPCYYLRHSAYFRWRTVVDGAVISTEDEHQLCLNTYSDRWEVLRDSDLGRIFGTAVVNPILLDRAAEAYIADCELDQNDEPAVLRYLQDKYGRPALMTMNLGSLVAYVESHLEEGANGSDT